MKNLTDIKSWIQRISKEFINHKIEFIGDMVFFQFSLDENEYLFQASEKIYYLLKKNKDGKFEYSLQAHYDGNLEYLGSSSNSLLPDNLDFGTLSTKEFLNYLTSTISCIS